MDIKAIAERLCRKLDTRDPFELAQALGILVLLEPLGDIQGYYNQVYRQKFIHINHTLEREAARFTCAHELGHALLHPRLNTPFLRKNTLYSLDKLELEANRLALEILYSDEALQPFLSRSITDAAGFMGVPVGLAARRMATVRPALWAGLSQEEIP